jgi:HEAT repeat protein
VREIAVEALGRNKDKESFAAVLKLVTDDRSIRVRTAAVVAMGHYADGRAVPVLVKALVLLAEGLSADGHADGDLRRAIVRSLGRIGSGGALKALYAGAKAGPARSQCVEFWTSTEEPEHLAAFLKLYDADPLDANLAAGVILSQLRNRKARQLAEKEQAAAEEAFFEGVDDPARFGPKADLSEGGKWRVRVTYAFHGEDFATVEFDFRDIRPSGYGHGYGVLYRKTGGKWKPMGKTLVWVE